MLLIDTTPESSSWKECWVWFADKPFRPSGYNVAIFKESYSEINSHEFKAEVFHTLWSDLLLPEDDLWGKIKKSKQRDIKIAKNRNWTISVGNSEEDIEIFSQAQLAFTQKKNLDPPLGQYVLNKNRTNCLLGTVYDSENRLICWNFYILAKPIVRLWMAGSDLDYHKSDRGYATSLLHWHMMLYFKNAGYQTYDWGGVNLDPASGAYSITEFKVGFGGTQKTFYNYYCDFPTQQSFIKKFARKAYQYIRKACSAF
jgi:lipid II:glycine glycyltransferase (peptidoglycan interpeptide bridge formation enzyme)